MTFKLLENKACQPFFGGRAGAVAALKPVDDFAQTHYGQNHDKWHG